MVLKMKTNSGELQIEDDVVITVVGSAATESFGVVGMAAKTLTDGVNELLNRQNFAKGVTIKQEGDLLVVDVHIVTSLGIKLPEVAKSVQKQVGYALEKQLGISLKRVNVIVADVRA